jgi:hypothetical protein
MTNSDSRNTLKTSFINNNNYTYNNAVASDFVKLTQGDHIVNTNIAYPTSSLYVVLKLDTTALEYVVADNTTMISSYRYVNPVTGIVSTNIRITLPTVSTIQQTIPFTGTWVVTLYNTRDNQRQSLSQALKPRADL